MKDVSKYTSELIDLVGHPEAVARVYAKCADNEELGYYILNKYNYLMEFIRKFSRESLFMGYGIEKAFSSYRSQIITTIEHSSMELCNKYGLDWMCYDNKCIYVNGEQIHVVDGFASICDSIVSAINKEKKLVRKESL